MSRLLDKSRYGRLLADVQPGVIHTQAEYRRLLRITKRLMEVPKLTVEEGRLLELLGLVVKEYEAKLLPQARMAKDARRAGASDPFPGVWRYGSGVAGGRPGRFAHDRE